MFGLFSNLLSELGGRANAGCGSTCYDSCTSVSIVNNDCLTECTSGCSNSLKGDVDGGDTGGVCITCFNSCSVGCTHACGWHTCGTVCNSVSSK